MREYFDSSKLPENFEETYKEIRDGIFINREGKIITKAPNTKNLQKKEGMYCYVTPYLNKVKVSDKVPYSWEKGYWKFAYNHKTYSVHRLLAEAWLPGYFEGAVVDHINNDSSDNRLENLQWLTFGDNLRKWAGECRSDDYKEKYAAAVKRAHAAGKYDNHMKNFVALQQQMSPEKKAEVAQKRREGIKRAWAEGRHPGRKGHKHETNK